MVKRNYTKLPSWYYFVISSVVVGGFLFAMLYNSNSSENYKAILPNEVIKKTTLNKQDNYGSLRGAVFYKPNRFIPEAILVNIKCTTSSNYLKMGVDIKNLNVVNENLNFKLSDVTLPYILYKGKDSLIYVTKEDCRMIFKLTKYEGPY